MVMRDYEKIFSCLADTINNFLLTKDISKDGKNITTGIPDGMYYPKIKAFEKFLNERRNLIENNQWMYLLSKIMAEDIEESMDYYIEESRKSPNPANHVKKRCVLESYKTVIYEYFRFLSVNNIKNINLIKTFDLWDDDPENFRIVTNRVSKRNNLIDTVKTADPISEVDFDSLYKTCDIIMERLKEIDPVKEEFRYIKFVRALIVKVMLYTGIKCEVLPSINELDLDIEHNTICINELTIHLPYNLRIQFGIYKNFRKKIVDYSLKSGMNKSEIPTRLFINNNGSLGIPGSTNDMSSNQFIAGFINSIIGRNDIKGIGKYVIIKMIEKGINQSIIQSFTGYKDDVFNHCQNYVNDKKANYKSRYLDSKIRSIETFDIL